MGKLKSGNFLANLDNSRLTAFKWLGKKSGLFMENLTGFGLIELISWRV